MQAVHECNGGPADGATGAWRVEAADGLGFGALRSTASVLRGHRRCSRNVCCWRAIVARAGGKPCAEAAPLWRRLDVTSLCVRLTVLRTRSDWPRQPIGGQCG